MITKKQKIEMANFIQNEGVESFCEYNKAYVEGVKDAELTALVKRFDTLKKKILVHIEYEQSLKDYDRQTEKLLKKTCKESAVSLPDPEAVNAVPCEEQCEADLL